MSVKAGTSAYGGLDGNVRQILFWLLSRGNGGVYNLYERPLRTLLCDADLALAPLPEVQKCERTFSIAHRFE